MAVEHMLLDMCHPILPIQIRVQYLGCRQSELSRRYTIPARGTHTEMSSEVMYV
jgi:hypothetical protein